MSLVASIIGVLLQAGFAIINIRRIAKGDSPNDQKAAQIKEQVDKVLKKMDAVAKNTEATWDDSLVSILSSAVDAAAEIAINELQ